MTPSDINFAYQCTRSEGWAGETREVFKAFLSYDLAGCFVAEQDSEKIGLCVATGYRHSGFIGELIIVKEKRGQGFGSRLLNHSIHFLFSKGQELGQHDKLYAIGSAAKG